MPIGVLSEIAYTAASAAAPHTLTVPTTTDRDRIGGNGVLRVGSLCYVVDNSTTYRLTSITPTVVFEVVADPISTRFFVVENNAARDLLTVNAGDRVRVLSRSVVEEWTGSTFAVVDRGNPDLLATLNAEFAIAGFFVDPANGDDEGAGTVGSPWLTLQRCADEIPRGASGFVVIEVLGGTQSVAAPDWEHLSCGVNGPLTVNIVGNHTEIEQVTLTSLTGGTGLVVNPNGGTYRGARLHNTSAPFSTQIDDTTHWLYSGFDYLGVQFPAGGLPIGTVAGTGQVESSGASSRLATLGSGSQVGSTFSICSFQTTITGRVRNTAKTRGVAVSYHGCRFSAQVVADCSLVACLCVGDTYLYGRHFSTVVHAGAGDLTVSSPEDSSIFARLTTGNLRLDGAAHVDGGSGFSFLNVGVSSRSTGATEVVRVGNVGKARVNVSLLDYLDVENATGLALLVRNADLRLSGSGVSSRQCSSIMRVSSGSRVAVSSTVYGRTTGVCFDLLSDCTVTGLAALAAAGAVTSVLGATSHVALASGTPVAFGSTPAAPAKLARWE